MATALFHTDGNGLKQEGHRRHYANPGLGDGPQLGLCGQVGVHDPVNPGLGGGLGGAGAPRVNGDAGIPAMGFPDYGGDLFLRHRLVVAPGTVGQLYEVNAVLGLPA